MSIKCDTTVCQACRDNQCMVYKKGDICVCVDYHYTPTTADRIRAMSDEELAQWMASRIASQKLLDIEMSGKQLTAPENAALTHDLYVVFGRYLQQPAEEDDHA